MTTTDTTTQLGTLHIQMPLREFAERLGLTTDLAMITPVAVVIDEDEVTIHADAPEGSYGVLRERPPA